MTEKRNYDGKDLAFSFQSQITVLLPQLILAEQIHSPAFLEQARIQSSAVLGAPPVSWSENFLDHRTVGSRKAHPSGVRTICSLFQRLTTMRKRKTIPLNFLVVSCLAKLLTPQGVSRMNCDLALKRKSQIFSIIISLLGNLGFERPNHFFLLISFTIAFFVKPNHIFSRRKPHFLGIWYF